MIDAIIPVRNEQKTLPRILAVFRQCQYISNVIVCVDGATGDKTEAIAKANAGYVVPKDAGIRGKGQLIKEGVRHSRTPYVLLCDGDYTGLTSGHITELAGDIRTQTIKIGVPEYPDETVPARVINSWPWVSGLRVVPVEILTALDLHGYLTEVQINMEAGKRGYTFRFKFMAGLVSQYDMSPARLAAMEADREWGIQNGVLR